MAMPNSAGRYIARPKTWGVGKSSGGAVEFACDFTLLYQQSPSGDWEDILTDGFEIVGYFYPINKEGKASAHAVKTIKDAFGWSGVSLRELNDNDWSSVEVQLTLEFEEYQGNQKLKVKWLNPRDYAGGNGVAKGDAALVKSFDDRFGAQLRAMNGNGAATTPPAKTPELVAKSKAWNAYKAKYPNAPADELNEGWKQRFHKYFLGKKPELVTVDEWNLFVADGFEKQKPISPLGDTKEFELEEIPF